jgi:tetratricopeptide (TPR) repeat protein
MSLIYDSLKKTVAEPEPAPVAQIRRQRRLVPLHVLRRSLIALGILGLVVAAGAALVFWVREEVQRLGPRLQEARTVPLAEPEPPQPSAAPAPAPAPEALLRTAPPPPPPTPVRTKIGIEDLARPTLELEALFTQKAKTNQRILDIERQMHAAWAQQDANRVRSLLTDLRQTAGPHSAVVQRWEGVLALAEGRPAQAEAVFRKLQAEGRDDAPTRTALAQALLAQNRTAEAHKLLQAHDAGHGGVLHPLPGQGLPRP